MPDQPQTNKPSNDLKDLPPSGKDLGVKGAEDVKGGRMRDEPEVTKNDTSDMYK